jgi:hypothetical protein
LSSMPSPTGTATRAKNVREGVFPDKTDIRLQSWDEQTCQERVGGDSNDKPKQGRVPERGQERKQAQASASASERSQSGAGVEGVMSQSSDLAGLADRRERIASAGLLYVYIHTYVYTYIHTYMHACILACMHT